MTVARRVNEAFEHARRQADGSTTIGPTALLLGIMAVEEALANRILRDTGASRERLHATIVAARG